MVAAERQITMLLVQYATPLAAVSLPRKINTQTNMQAASPANESARLFHMIGVGADVIRAFGGVVLVTAALSLFIALYHALNERAYDIAVLRTLGSRPIAIALMLMVEALMLAILGGVLGLLLAHGLAAILAWWMTEQQSLRIDPWAFSASELWLLVPALLAALLRRCCPVGARPMPTFRQRSRVELDVRLLVVFMKSHLLVFLISAFIPIVRFRGRTLGEVEPVKQDGKMVPQFSGKILGLDGKQVRVQGFILPMDMGEKQKHFLISAVPPHCPFCLPAGPDAVVEVYARKPIAYSMEPILVTGKLAVLKSDPSGLLYRLSEAESIQTKLK